MRRLKLLRSHGEDASKRHMEIGYTSRLHGLQAALLRTKLPMLSTWNEMRRQAAALYARHLQGADVRLPNVADGSEHVFHLYCARVANRDSVRAFLGERGIQTGIHYAAPLHLEPAFEYLGGRPGQFPVAEKATREIVSLPMYPYISEREIETVAHAVKEAVAHV